jgi:hypothetical protein
MSVMTVADVPVSSVGPFAVICARIERAILSTIREA